MVLQIGRVLVVEDDAACGAVIVQALRNAEFDTLWARTELEAYGLLPTLPTIRALIVDANPGQGTTGFDVARFARRVIPDVAVVYIGGEDWQFHRFGVPSSELLVKPFTTDQLLAALRRRL